MLGMRIGAVMAARKKGYKLTGRRISDTEELQTLAESETHETINDFDIKESSKERLVMTKYPFIEWSVAFVFLLAFGFCEFMNFIVNQENKR